MVKVRKLGLERFDPTRILGKLKIDLLRNDPRMCAWGVFVHVVLIIQLLHVQKNLCYTVTLKEITNWFSRPIIVNAGQKYCRMF